MTTRATNKVGTSRVYLTAGDDDDVLLTDEGEPITIDGIDPNEWDTQVGAYGGGRTVAPDAYSKATVAASPRTGGATIKAR